MITFVCIRCLTTWDLEHDPVSGKHFISRLCECGAHDSGAFLGRERMENPCPM